jgi:hypothetical protein
MAADRFVYFEGERAPTSAEVQRILENFFNGVGQLVRDGARWTVRLPGRPCSALAGVDGARVRALPDDERWLEVYHQQGSQPYVDVITRAQDEFVSSLADGLVAVFKRFYRGRVEDA